MAIGLCLLSRMSGFLAFLDAATSLSTAAGLGAAACLKAVSWVSGEPSSLLRRIHRRPHSGVRRFHKLLKPTQNAR